mmetsp:Transcript_65642/g.185482  ORF Transcript_65642/g.185482 Transcript_65642/m.185482 type:complete len:221 (+) Transcript_65642:172-834(+)
MPHEGVTGAVKNVRAPRAERATAGAVNSMWAPRAERACPDEKSSMTGVTAPCLSSSGGVPVSSSLPKMGTLNCIIPPNKLLRTWEPGEESVCLSTEAGLCQVSFGDLSAFNRRRRRASRRARKPRTRRCSSTIQGSCAEIIAEFCASNDAWMAFSSRAERVRAVCRFRRQAMAMSSTEWPMRRRRLIRRLIGRPYFHQFLIKVAEQCRTLRSSNECFTVA